MENVCEKIYTVQEIKELLQPVFKKWNFDKVWLFGSYARGEATEKSDVDLWTEGGATGGLFKMGGFYNDLEEALQKSIDVVSTESLKHPMHPDTTRRFIEEVRRERLLIYDK